MCKQCPAFSHNCDRKCDQTTATRSAVPSLEKYYSPKNQNYLARPVTLDELRMCERMVKGGPSGWKDCPEDPTCWKCLEPRAQEMATNMTNSFKNTELVETRRALVREWFSGVDKEEEPILLLITDSNFGEYSQYCASCTLYGHSLFATRQTTTQAIIP